MPPPRDEDLFTDSTMTFGEHLEELRRCLWRAILGLALGVAAGLFFGRPVVNFIQAPLTDALKEYYEAESQQKLDATLAALGKGGTENEAFRNRTRQLIKEQRMLADEAYVDPVEMYDLLKELYPRQMQDVPPPATLPSTERDGGLVPLFLWHRQADDPRVQLKSLSAQETFGIYMKASIFVGLVVSSPWVFYQIWLFVAAGLYPHEKRFVHLYLPISLGLFLLGASVVFLFVFQPVLRFLFSFNTWLGIAPEPRISEWLGFVLFLPVGFGIGFQLPLVMYFLERVGIFTVEAYVRQWRLSVLIIVILAAILTPPDPYSMMCLAGPLVILFFGGIFLCKYMPRRKRTFEELK
ncbi:MAG: twin-arginine translocase subunit TatC [Pirellulales bacterium]|nr:twin-arginine translocase subunit TatC [Pirellulales bacterium]